MIPSATDIVRWRSLVAAFARLIGCLLFVLAALPLLSWLAEGISDGDLFDLGYYATRAAAGVALPILGVALVFLAPYLARIVVPVRPETGCPRCGYSVTGLAESLCPECGLDLPPEIRVGGPGPPPLTDEVWLIRARAAAAATLRLFALLAVGFSLLLAVMWTLEMLMWGESRHAVLVLCGYAVWLAAGPGLLWALARPIGTLAVPHPRR